MNQPRFWASSRSSQWKLPVLQAMWEVLQPLGYRLDEGRGEQITFRDRTGVIYYITLRCNSTPTIRITSHFASHVEIELSAPHALDLLLEQATAIAQRDWLLKTAETP